jgi:hypothetical protein
VVTSRCGSPAVVTGGGLATCTCGRACPRHMLWPAHGGRAQSKCSESFTRSQWCCGCKELERGSPCSSIHARRRSDGVRRWQSGASGEMVFCMRAREALWGSREASRGARLDGGGPEWPVHGGWARAADGTPHAERTPANSCSARVGGVRGSTIIALGCFIGVGSGVAWRGLARRAQARQDRSNTWTFVSALVQTPVGRPNVQILPKILCKVSSLCLGLSVLCEFQVKIWSGVGDMVAPS